jgi:DNA-binding SARP family transcriptional activator
MPQFRILLLGLAQCTWEGEPPVRLGRPGQLLLGYLVLNRGRAHSRERLAELLWADDGDDGRPRRRLNTTLWRLRQSLAPPGSTRTEWLTSTATGEVSFAPAEGPPTADAPCWIDVEAFTGPLRSALRTPPQAASAENASAVEAAIDLYGGDLLEGCYEDWVLSERRVLQDLLLAGLDWLIRHHAAGQRLEVALQVGRRLLMHDPLREDVHRSLMTLYDQAGKRREALRQYDYCRDLLASELGITPECETEALHQQLLVTGSTRAHPIGAERHVLEQLLVQVRAMERALETALGECR